MTLTEEQKQALLKKAESKDEDEDEDEGEDEGKYDDEDEDEGEDEGEDNGEKDSELERLKKENELLRNKTKKLLHKKGKAIANKAKSDNRGGIDEDQLESWYSKRVAKERFMNDNPSIDYDVVQAISEKKGIDLDQAIHYLKSGGTIAIGKDFVNSENKQSEERIKRLSKSLGLE